MALTTTLSSVGTSPPLILDYIGAGTCTAQITLTSTSMTVNGSLQATLDSSAASGVAPVWYLASTTAITSAISGATGLTVNFLTPIAGLRISSTAISSSSIVLTALQTVGG